MFATEWGQTQLGRTLFVEFAGRKVAIGEKDFADPGTAHRSALSIWEGVAGNVPRHWLARWRWRRGLRALHNRIVKAMRREARLLV